MTSLTIVVVAFVLALLLFGFAFWTPIYALPFVVLFLVGLAFALFRRRGGEGRELRAFRAQAGRAGPEHETRFTERDRETLYDR
jgi:uncharacterized membrane protein